MNKLVFGLSHLGQICRTALSLAVLVPFVLGSAVASPSSYEKLVAQGVLTRSQAQSAPMTRGEFVLAVQRLFQLKPSSKQNDFTDVSADSPTGQALQSLEDCLGRHVLCPGCALSTDFLPGQPVSRSQAFYTLTCVLVKKNKLQLLSPAETERVLATIQDAGRVPLPARAYFATGLRAGIFGLTPDNKIGLALEPDRASVAGTMDAARSKF